MNQETVLMNKIRIKLSEYGVCFRANVGKVRMIDGRYFDTGLPKGFSDLFGVKANNGQVFFVEVKTDTGKVRPEQIQFINRMKELGALAGVARSVEDAIDIVEGRK
ncbi:VRR-NUC domain-containing protein [Aerococcaceae bacterium zg-ZJ1578]|nr:VRR-NUC domain-containing protein [Aerococcaceae bacterium zg-1578]